MDPTDTGEMIVKRVSVPIGLEELMEGLVKEVLLKKPDDMYFFAAKYFSKLLLLRDKGQPKAQTIRSAQSLTDQREKRFQTKIPVSGVTKQLSRQFSIRGESPMRNFDSPIVSQKPKMHDRNASKYKRRNTGPPTIPENHMNIVVRKKYSRSVSTERKRETGHSVSSTKRSTNRKESKEMQNESDEKSVRNRPGDKRKSVTKELQKNLMKNVPTNQVVQKIAGQRNISEKDETAGDSKSDTETADSNGSGQINNKIQPYSIVNSSKLRDDSGLASEKTAAPIENSNVENSKEESEDGKNNLIENVVGVDDVNEKPQMMEHLSEGILKSSDEVLNVSLKLDTSSEKSKSSSDTLDNLTMESENAGISGNKESRSVSVDSHENDEDTTNNSDFTNASKLAYSHLNELKGDSKSAGEENGEHVTGVTTNESQKTEDILEDNRKAIATEILSKEDLKTNDKENIALVKNTVGEERGYIKSESNLDQPLLESFPITHTETRGREISDETNFDGSDKNEMNNSNIKTKQRIDSEDQEICGENHRENAIEKKVIDDIGRLVTEKETINKEGHDGVNDSHHISVDNAQEKTNTETSVEHKIMSSEMSLESSMMEHDRNEDAANKVALDEGGDPEKRGVKEDFGKGTDHSSSENDTIGMISNDGVDIKNSGEENHNNAIIIEKPSSTEHYKDNLLGESFTKSSTEDEGDAMDNGTSEIIIDTNSSTEKNKVETKEQVPNDHLLTGKQSNIESVSKEITNSLSDKEHNESMTNQVKDSSETDRSLEKISTEDESTKILHNEIDQAENEPVSKIGPVKSENHIKSSEKKDIPNTNSTTDKESFDNAGNERISRNESAKDEEMKIKDCKTLDSQKPPQISDNKSHKESNDQSIVSESSDSLGRELNESKTAKIIPTITENSELLNDNTTSYTEEHKIESSHINEGPRAMKNDIETEGKEKSETRTLKEHQNEQLTGSMELMDPKSDDILIQKANREQNNTETDTTEKNELISNTSEEIELEETAEKSVTQNLKENQEEMSSNHENLKKIDLIESELDELKSDHHSAIRNDINPIEVSENTVIKEMGTLTNSDTIGDGEIEGLLEEKSVSTKDTGAFDRNENGPADETKKIGAITLSKTNDEHEHNSALHRSSVPEENVKLKNSKLEQVVDNNGDVANNLNGQTESKRNSQDSDTESNFKRESISDSKGIEEESKTVDETDSKKISNINTSDWKQRDIDTSENKTNVGIIDKVAKNYISYVIDKENYRKYNENDKKEDDTTNTTNSINDDKLQSSFEEQNDENSNIQKDDNQTSFDRLKLREELGIPSMEEPIKFDREELKRNISSTLSIAETGLIDTPAKTFINNFISNERGEPFGKKCGGTNNEQYKMTQSTKVGSEEGDNKNDSNPNGLQSNESFDRSKLREELQKVEQESKFTSFKQSFNSSLLRQELEHAALLKKSTKNNGYSSTLAKAAAVVRIQSMWRGFIVRKSFPKPQYDGEFSVHRDENSNVYHKKIQAPIESKLYASSIDDKENNEDPKLMESVATIQRCWRGFKVRKHLNSIRLKQNSEESARIKRHVDDKNIDFFDTMMAAVKIQKIWRGFITRKKLNITKNLSKKCENKKVVDIDGTDGELVGNQKSPGNTENIHTNESNESNPKSHDGITIKQIDHLPLMKNDNNGSNEDSKSVPVVESKMHGEMTSAENLMTGNISTFPDQKSNEDDRKRINCITKIQSLWRGFLVRKYVKQLKKQMAERRDGGTHNTDGSNFRKDESQRPVSIDSNDSSNTVIFNETGHKKSEEGVKSHDDLLLDYTNMIHRDFDDVDASLDEILEYPLIKDEHLIDDYQNELLDRISGKQKDTVKDPANTVETVSPKRIEEIKAEELKDVSALHTSILSNSVGQDKNESQIEQTRPRSKLERVIEESSSPTDEDPIDLKMEQANGKTTTTTTEAEERKLSFCSEPSAPPSGTKVINGKPLSNYVEQIETNQKSLSTRGDSEITQNERDGDIIEHTHSRTMEENADRECGSASAENSQSGLENVKLLHSGEWHDTIVIPLPKPVTESLKTDTQNGRIGHFQGSEASEKSLDSTADISSILSNASAGLLHTGEMHDGIVVPISLSSLGRTISSGGEDNGIDTVDSHTQAVQNQEVRTIDNTTNNGAASVAVQVLQAPEPEVLTSPTPLAAAGDVTRADEGRSAQTPNKEDLRIQSEVSPCVSQSMESERAGKTEEKIMEAQAATKIQAGFRGYQVRKQLKLKNGSSDMNPPKRPSRGKCAGRSDSAKSQSNRPKDVEEKSAVKIQAGVRGFLVRRRQKKQSNQES